MKIFYKINDWLDRKLERIREDEKKIEGFKLPPIPEADSKADWVTFFSRLPTATKDLRHK